MAVSEVRHTAVTNSKNSVFRIAFIDENVFYEFHNKKQFQDSRFKFNNVYFCHDSAKQTSLMAFAVPKIENFVKNF